MDTPEQSTGKVTFWISLNSVNGADGNLGDMWNRLTFHIPEGSDDTRKTSSTALGPYFQEMVMSSLQPPKRGISNYMTWEHRLEHIG